MNLKVSYEVTVIYSIWIKRQYIWSDWGFSSFISVSLLLSGVTVALHLNFHPLANKPLKHTNIEMDTVVTIILNQNDTPNLAEGSGGGEGGGTQTQIQSPIVSSLKEKTDKRRTLKHFVDAAYLNCSRAKGCDAMTGLWMGPVCKREGRGWEQGWGGPFSWLHFWTGSAYSLLCMYSSRSATRWL